MRLRGVLGSASRACLAQDFGYEVPLDNLLVQVVLRLSLVPGIDTGQFVNCVECSMHATGKLDVPNEAQDYPRGAMRLLINPAKSVSLQCPPFPFQLYEGRITLIACCLVCRYAHRRRLRHE